MNKKQETIIGIDLGTTNSEVAVVQNEKVTVLKVDGHRIVPSVVSLNTDGTVLVGRVAVNNELANPKNTIRSIKRKIGNEEVLRLGEHEFTPPMISGLILKRLKLAVEEFLGYPVTKAVITVPAFFTEKQREATQEAASFAGLEAIRLINEPTAAALAYSLRKKEGELCLIYDLGGGTFDVSIVHISPQITEVKASHGDTALGGSDIDHLIAEKAREEFLNLHGIDLASDPISWARLMRAAENAKITLSTESMAQISEEFIATKDGVSLHLKYKCLRTDLEKMVTPMLERTIDSVKTALKMAEITPEQLNRIIFVGGMTSMPLITEMLEKELKIAPQAWIDPATVVARGAAIEAASLTGQSLGPYLVDITPHSLGTSCLDKFENLFNHILIRRNSIIPCTASHIFYKVFDRQDTVSVEVFQGESRDIAQNKFLGKFFLEGLKESPGREIHIKFHIDRSGILHVAASDVATGKVMQRRLKKVGKHCQKNVDFANLDIIRLYTNNQKEDPSSEEEWDDDWENEMASEETEENQLSKTVSLESEALLAKVQTLLDSKDLEASDQEELRRELASAKKGSREAFDKLADLVYYLE